MLSGLTTTAAGTQLHLSNEKALETALRLGDDFSCARFAAARRARSCQLCRSEALYSPASNDVGLESC